MYYLLSKIFTNILWQKPTTTNEIFLTFDDGPHPEYTMQILNILKYYQAGATFFVTGENANKYPQIVKQINEDGHAIGLHSYTHPRFIGKSRHFILSEIVNTQQTIQEIIHEKVTLFRPPYGHFTVQMLRICKQAHIKIVIWTVLSYDFNIKYSNDQIIQKMMKYSKPGTIHVLHDGHKNSRRTVEILPTIIEFYRSLSLKLSPL